VSKSRNDSPTTSAYRDHEVIVPPHKLEKALSFAAGNTTHDVDAIARAEAALEQLSSQFSGWMREECDRLDRAREHVHEAGLNGRARDELFRAAHDIRGQATTLGYPLAAEAAESLCRLIEHSPDLTCVPIHLIDQHVLGIRAMVREDARERGNATAEALAACLRQVTDDFLIEANQHRPGYLDGIVAGAPSIVPDA
jgi:ribosome modulation factor